MTRVVFVTPNQGRQDDLRRLIPDLEVELRRLDLPVDDGLPLEEAATRRALAAHARVGARCMVENTTFDPTSTCSGATPPSNPLPSAPPSTWPSPPRDLPLDALDDFRHRDTWGCSPGRTRRWRTYVSTHPLPRRLPHRARTRPRRRRRDPRCLTWSHASFLWSATHVVGIVWPGAPKRRASSGT